jgi:hypothetical protein
MMPVTFPGWPRSFYRVQMAPRNPMLPAQPGLGKYILAVRLVINIPGIPASGWGRGGRTQLLQFGFVRISRKKRVRTGFDVDFIVAEF